MKSGAKLQLQRSEMALATTPWKYFSRFAAFSGCKGGGAHIILAFHNSPSCDKKYASEGVGLEAGQDYVYT